MNKHPIVVAGGLLALFATAGTGLVAFTYAHTHERIAANERLALLDSLSAIVPQETIDNDLTGDILTVHDPDLLGTDSTTVYRGRKQGEPAVLVLNPVVPDGYAGPIKLLVAVRRDGSLGGVRVVSHKETPGLADKIEEDKSDWITRFTGRSLDDPRPENWRVKRDGGVFDQFTGATITPRSIVKAVKNTLLYVREHRAELYSTAYAEASQRENN